MNDATPTLEDRFIGCLLGLAVGDGLGANFEGLSDDYIRDVYHTAEELVTHPPAGELRYTDDTQMAIGIAETLVACQTIDEHTLLQRFAANYARQRGYGRGTRRILETVLEGADPQLLIAEQFPGGSFGNGAAMRVAPVGATFHHDFDRLWEEARRSALPTHTHPLGVEGAQLLALAVGLAIRESAFEREAFFTELAARCRCAEYIGPLRRAARIDDARDLALFGNGIEAASSVVTAIASFALTPDSYEQTIGNVIVLGGDTDTIAAMAGAISGAHLGWQAIPSHLLQNLENGYQGREFIRELATRLHSIYAEANCGPPKE